MEHSGSNEVPCLPTLKVDKYSRLDHSNANKHWNLLLYGQGTDGFLSWSLEKKEQKNDQQEVTGLRC